jgi:hypothetical protein
MIAIHILVAPMLTRNRGKIAQMALAPVCLRKKGRYILRFAHITDVGKIATFMWLCDSSLSFRDMAKAGRL